MASPHQIIHTPRLVLRLNDPDDEEDCQKIIQIYNDRAASQGGNARVGVNTPDDVRAKHRQNGPRQQFCTKAVAPKGLFHLIFLKDESGESGELVGFIGMSFRCEMPWPDLGYALFQPFWGRGLASEAGRAALKWWQEEIGVKEVWTGPLEKNIKSQRCAEKIGFVRCGEIDIMFGTPGEETWTTGLAFVLPGMEWKQYDKDGRRPFIRPTVGVESEKQKQDPLSVA